jgi:hypothetical protein
MLRVRHLLRCYGDPLCCGAVIAFVCARAGVGISVDGGKTFKAYPAGLTADARYGAFPSDSVWYVAAGTSTLIDPCRAPALLLVLLFWLL